MAWAVAGISVVLSSTAGGVTGVAGAAPVPPPCAITPVLRDVTINQGVGSYATMTRGKDTIVRGYFSLPNPLPACAGNGSFVQVTGGSLTVNGGTATTVAPTPVPVAPFAQVPAFSAAPAPDAPADLRFVVPGTAFDSPAATSYTASFSLTLSWQSAGSRSGDLTAVTSTTYTSELGSSSPITATVGPPSNRLGLLVVPIGNKTDPGGFPASAATAVQNGIAAVSRVLPVRTGIGDLGTAGKGLAFTMLPTSSMLDVGPNGLNLMSSGKLCIEPVTNWPRIAAQLATYLQDWNATNPGRPADRAVGAVWEGASAGAEANCYEGIADVGGRQAMVRAYTTQASFTGALTAHEVLHTLGGSHSLNTTADKDAPNRAYNTVTRQFLQVNRSLMSTTFDADYTDTTTLYESGAYAQAQCALTPGATGCANPGSVGAAGAGGPALVLSGSTCGDGPSCTNVVSYLDGDFSPRTTPDPGSPFTVVQYNGSTPLLTTPVPVPCDQEDDSVGGGPVTAGTACNVSLGITTEAAADRVELRKGSQVLYSAADDGLRPLVKAGGPLATASLSNYTAKAGNDTQPAVCGDLLAWVDGTGIRVRPIDKSAPASKAGALPGAEPSWSPDCARLVYTTTGRGAGAVRIVPVNAGGSAAPTFGTPTTIYNASLLGVGLLLPSPAGHPSFAADGRRVVVGINNDIYRIDPGSVLTPTQLICALPVVQALLARGCVAIVTSGAAETNPSVSTGDTIAYERGGNVWTARIDGSDQALFITDARIPAWAGDATLFVRGGKVFVRDIDGTDVQLTSGNDTWPASEASGHTFAIDRATGTDHDIWLGTTRRTGVKAIVTDNHIADVTVAVFVTCGDTFVPVQDPVPATSVRFTAGPAGEATYLVPLDPSTVCDGGHIVVRASDRWLTSTADGGQAGSPHAPVANVYSLPEGIHLTQFESWAFFGGGTDADEPSAGLTLTWSITGPGGYASDSLTGANPPDVHPPAGGFAPGQYTGILTVRDSTGATSTDEYQWFVDPDADHDGVPASEDLTCAGASADNDPASGDLDSDGDGVANRLDPEPCSAPNATLSITPTVINITNTTGTPINMTIESATVDLTTIDPATVGITTIGGVALAPPLAPDPGTWSAAATSATARFDRPAINQVLADNNLIGGAIVVTVAGSGTPTNLVASGTAATCSGNNCDEP